MYVGGVVLLRNFPFVGGRLTVLTRFRERAIRSYRTIDRVGPSTGQSTRSCRAIQGGFLLLAMLCSYLVSDTWPLPSLSRSTGYLGFLLLAMLRSCLVSDTWPLPSFSRSTGHTRSICLSLSARKQGPQASGHSRSKC